MFSGFSISDKINTILIFVSTIGVIAAFWQIRYAARTQRVIFLKDLYLQLHSDKEIARVFYRIEYDEFKYSEDFHGSEEEQNVDNLLTLLDLICELHFRNVISIKEMEFFDYSIYRVSENSEIKKYMVFISNFLQNRKLKEKIFPAYNKYILKFENIKL